MTGYGTRGEAHGCRRRAVQPDLGDVEGRDGAVIGTEDQPGLCGVEGERTDPWRRGPRDRLAGSEILGPDLGPRRDVDALACPCSAILAARLDRDSADGIPELIRRRDVVGAPQHETAGHGVLGEMRVRPFVDRVGFAVAPVLQEFRGRPRVIDLVEVHLVRLGEPEQAQPERREDQDEDEPGIEAVESAAALAHERPAPVGARRDRVQPVVDPPADPDLLESGGLRPGRQRRRSRPRATDGQRHATRGADGNAAAISDVIAGLGLELTAGVDLLLEPLPGGAPQL